MTIRGFAGLPDGSEWIADEVPLEGDETVTGPDEAERFEAAGRDLARRMQAAGATGLLRAAEGMTAR